jgi:hypothetical protein
MSVKLQPPPGDSVAQPEGEGSGAETGPQRFEIGPLLYAGFRQGDSAVVVPVAEIDGDRLRPFPHGEAAQQLAAQILEERLRPGEELVLFHRGARIGTFFVSGPQEGPSNFCPPRGPAVGAIELVPSANEAQRFLALEKGPGEYWPMGGLPAVPLARAQQNAAHNLAAEALNELRAQWPPALQNIREDMQGIQFSTSQGPSVVATFLFRDQLGIQAAPEEAYSLLVFGEPSRNRFQRTFTWYRRVADEGKGAPRLFSWTDWDRDGDDEVLLEVFGSEARWWAAVNLEDGQWALAFQDPCGIPEDRPAGDPAPEDRPR